jgi:hypothetical protein
MKTWNQNKLEKTLTIVAFSSLFSGLIILLGFIFFLYQNFIISSEPDIAKVMENTGNVGDFFGGVIGSFWSLTGIFLLYFTLKMQKEELVNQRTELQNTREVFEVQKFENTFFNLLQHQRELRLNLKTTVVSTSLVSTRFSYEHEDVQGLNVLDTAVSEMRNIMHVLGNHSFNNQDEEYFNPELLRIYAKHGSVNLLGEVEFNSQNEELNDDISALFSDYVSTKCIQFYKITEREHSMYRKTSPENQCRLIYSILFDQLGNSIGHYFRNIYHILKFIDESKQSILQLEILDERKSKIESDFKRYTQFIQAQLSSTELLLLFYNSLLFPKAYDLIVKYDLLENLSFDLLLDESHNGVKGIVLTKKDSFLRQDVLNSFNLPA